MNRIKFYVDIQTIDESKPLLYFLEYKSSNIDVGNDFKLYFQLVSNIYESDFILLPHYIKHIALELLRNILKQYTAEKIVGFNHGDKSIRLRQSNVIIFQTSAMSSGIESQNIAYPVFIKDSREALNSLSRVDSYNLPLNRVVGFCGKAIKNLSWRQNLTY